MFSPRSLYAHYVNGSIKAHPSSTARQALLPRLSQCIHYRRSRLAAHAHHRTAEGEPVARLCSLSFSLSLSHWNRQRLNLWRRAKEGREPPPSSSSSSSIHPSLTLFLNKMRFFLLSQLGRKSLVCKQIEGSFVRKAFLSKPRPALPPLPLRRNAANAMGTGGERACAGLVCNGEGRRAEGRWKATFPPRQKNIQSVE